MTNEQSCAGQSVRSLDAILAVALQLKAQLDAKDGIKRNLGNEAVMLRVFGYKNSEIAGIIGSTTASVSELIRRAQMTSKRSKKAK